MMRVPEWTRPVTEVLQTPQNAEAALEATRIYRPIIRWRNWPDVALSNLSGIFIPTHERLMLYAAHLGAPSTVYVCGRGTSKSAVLDVLYAVIRALLYPKRKGVLLSAGGFRGGQLIFNDIEKWIKGGWYNQQSDLGFIERSVVYDKLILRQQNYWQIDLTSASHLMTVPTNDPEKIRGIRANDLYIDEANFADLELVEKVAASFLNVLADFETGGENAQANNVVYTTTIDYGWRDFQKTANAAREGLERDMAALEAAKKGDWETHTALVKKGVLRHMYVTLDYTDTIIRETGKTRDGRAYKIKWPDPRRKFKHDTSGIPFTVVGENGKLLPHGVAQRILTTYPINRDMEMKLLSGETPEAIWLAEQRNVVDTSTGDVYPHFTVDSATCKGAGRILHRNECTPEFRAKYPDEDIHFVPNVQWSCSDPCVLGVDYAPGSRDFSAFVVIRVGPCAKDEFNPVTGLGKTSWSNVVWAEQHRLTSHKDVDVKIRELAERYNLIFYHDSYELDTWKLCRAIGLDMRGGGSGVRDELVLMNKTDLTEGEYRIYDPLDADERVRAFATDPQARPMLDAIYPTDQLNDKLVEYTLGQMTQKLLYLAKDIPDSQRPFDLKLDVGYNGVKVLSHQLRALQQKPTKNFRQFYMKGDVEQAVNKKDLWAAFIYAAKQMRAHVIRQRMIEDTPPPMGAVITRVGGNNRGRTRLY